MSAHIQLGGRRISADDPCYIIAEIGVNHNGDIRLAHKMIDSAKMSGADAVKFQTYKTEALIAENTPKAEYQKQSTGIGSQDAMLRQLELPNEAFADINTAARCVSILCRQLLIAKVWNCNKLAPVCLKWPSELNNTPFCGKLQNMICQYFCRPEWVHWPRSRTQ